MSTIRILLGIFCLAVISCSAKPDSSVLARAEAIKDRAHLPYRHGAEHKDYRERILIIARYQIGVQELTGHNDGAAVEAYLKVINLPKGNPWCAAFVSWVFKQAGYAKPRTAWSPALFSIAMNTLLPKPADVLGIYSIKLKRIAHCGLVERKQNNWIISIEGNTNLTGSREGDGVYRKWRHIRTTARFADWVKK